MIASLRLLLLATLTNAGYLYAVWQVLRQGKLSSVAALSSESAYHSDGTAVESAATETVARRRFTLDVAALKLCIVMTAMGALTAIGADAFPLFPELRVIVMFLLLFAPPATQAEVYDKAFSPLLVRVGSFMKSAQSNELLTKRFGLFLVRNMVECSIAIMNYVDRSGVLEADAVKDILGGLVFTRRALADVAARQRERDGPSSPLSVMSTISSSGGAAAMQAFQRFTASYSSSDDKAGLTASPSSAGGDTYGTAGSRPSAASSIFSAVEQVDAYDGEHRRKKRS